MHKPVYEMRNGKPEMQISFLIFIDILGYQELTRSVPPEGQNELLARLHAALARHVPVLNHQDEKEFPPSYASRVFTDNIVLARPLYPFSGGDGEGELGRMMLDAGLYQLNLALDGFYVRGGIAVGPAYVDDHVVFGPALIEAHDIEEKRAVFPRIVLSEPARECVKKHVGYYAGGAAGAPHNNELLVDSDGEWFLNYMDSARGDNDPDLLPSYRIHVKHHRDQAVKNIVTFSENRRVLEKYLWVGRYHNYVARYLYPNDNKLLVPDKLLSRDFCRLAEVLPRDKYGLGIREESASRPSAKGTSRPAKAPKRK